LILGVFQLLGVTLQLGGFLFCKDEVFAPPIDWRKRRQIVDALQVRVAVRQAALSGGLRGFRRGLAGRREDRPQEQSS
jgi:hypothetical protein